MTKEVWESLRNYRNAESGGAENCYTCIWRKTRKGDNGASYCRKACYHKPRTDNPLAEIPILHRAYKHKVCDYYEELTPELVAKKRVQTALYKAMSKIYSCKH